VRCRPATSWRGTWPPQAAEGVRCLLAVLLSLAAFPSLADNPSNLLNNPGFEITKIGLPVDWALAEGCSLVTEAHSGKHALRILNNSDNWNLATQYLMLSGAKVQQIELTGWIRLKNVKRGDGKEDAALVQVGFYDDTGGETGDWFTVGPWTGTFGWEHFTEQIEIPPTAARIAVMVGLQNCTGAMWVDDLQLTATKFTGPRPVRATESRTDTRDWHPFKPVADDYKTPAATDVSFLLDAPAGKHGFLTTRPDGHLYFEDGTRARFWGVDFVAPAPYCSHEDAEKIAARLAKYGVNIVRLHHLDADWSDPNIFDPKPDDTQHLSAASLDKLDYLLAQFKQRGIYVYLDFLVNRKFKPGDQVRDGDDIDSGAKIVAHFNPRIIALEQKYMRQVMTHENPYTKLRWFEDPVIAMMEVINEDSLFYEPWYDRVPASYMPELQGICKRIDPRADPAKMPFDEPTLRALYKVQTDYFLQMKAVLRDIGVKVPITGSNHWENMAPDIYSNSQMDYIDRHYYWDHPEGSYGADAAFDNRPQVRSPFEEGLVQEIADTKIVGKPLVVTEWCLCWTNEYMAEGPLIAAAYANLQDWDAMIRFDFTGTQWADVMSGNFDIGNKPSVMAQWPAAALLFYRRDLPAAERVIRTAMTEKDIFARNASTLTGKPVAWQVPPQEAYSARIETVLGAQASTPALPASEAPAVMGEDGLKWDRARGLITLDTDCTAAVAGFPGKCGQIAFKHCTIASRTPFAAIWVSSLDGKPIPESRHLLITANARAENSGTVYNAGRNALKSHGQGPILLEPVRGSVLIKRAEGAGPLQVFPLLANGKRQQGTTLPVGTGAVEVQIGEGDSFWYELAEK